MRAALGLISSSAPDCKFCMHSALTGRRLALLPCIDRPSVRRSRARTGAWSQTRRACWAWRGPTSPAPTSSRCARQHAVPSQGLRILNCSQSHGGFLRSHIRQVRMAAHISISGVEEGLATVRWGVPRRMEGCWQPCFRSKQVHPGQVHGNTCQGLGLRPCGSGCGFNTLNPDQKLW